MMTKASDMLFSEAQIALLERLGLPIQPSDADYERIEAGVSAYLQQKGVDETYSPTEDGKLCESILDML